MRRSGFGRLALCSATACLALVSTTSSNASASYADAVVTIDGVWKAHVSYTDRGNRLCVRAYNSNRNAQAHGILFIGTTGHHIWDWGGDSNPRCRQLDVPEDVTMQVDMHHINGQGEHTSGTVGVGTT